MEGVGKGVRSAVDLQWLMMMMMLMMMLMLMMIQININIVVCPLLVVKSAPLKSPIRSQADNALRIKSSSTTVEEVDPTIMIEHRLPTISDLFSNLTKITAVPVYITKQSSQSQSATPNW